MYSLLFSILFASSALCRPTLNAEERENTDPVVLPSEESVQFRNLESALLLAQNDAVFRDQNPIRLRRFIRTEASQPEKQTANLVQNESQVARSKRVAKDGKQEDRRSKKGPKRIKEEKLKSNPVGRSAVAGDAETVAPSTSQSPDIESGTSTSPDNEPEGTSLVSDTEPSTSLSETESDTSSSPDNEPSTSLTSEAEPGTSLSETESGTSLSADDKPTSLAGEVTDATQAAEQSTEASSLSGTDGADSPGSTQAAQDQAESEPNQTAGEPASSSENPAAVDQSDSTQADSSDSTNEPILTSESSSELADSTTVQENLTSEPDNLTSESDNLTSETDNLTSEPDNLTSESDNLTSESDNLTSEPDNTTGESDNLTSESDNTTGEMLEPSSESPALNGTTQVNATSESAITQAAPNVTAVPVDEPTAKSKPCLRKLNSDDADYVDDVQNALINDRRKYYNGRNLAKQQQQSKFMIDFLGWLCIAAFGFICGILIGLMVFSGN